MMTTVRFIGCAAACGLVMGAMACTSVRSGTAQPTPSAPTSSAPAAAPTVAVGLPLTKLSTDPCSLLSSQQLAGLGLSAATTTQRDQSTVATGCEWNDATVGNEGGVQLDVDWLTPLRHGLSDIYLQRRTAAYWQPVAIAGYPGVLTDIVDERGTGTCRLGLGATNTAVIDLSYQGSVADDPCRKVQVLAAAVVSSLEGGS
jgi:hypothetical protein